MKVVTTAAKLKSRSKNSENVGNNHGKPARKGTGVLHNLDGKSIMKHAC